MGDRVHRKSTTFESYSTGGHGDLRGDAAQLSGHAARGDQQQHDRVILRHVADHNLRDRDDWSVQCDATTDISFFHGHLRSRSGPPVILRGVLLHRVFLRTGASNSAIPVTWYRRR